MPYRSIRTPDIQYKDFTPMETAKKTLFFPATYEPINHVMGRLNDWINDHEEIELINIETVVLPNMYKANADGAESSSLRSSGHDGRHTYWHQFIRVWFREKSMNA